MSNVIDHHKYDESKVYCNLREMFVLALSFEFQKSAEFGEIDSFTIRSNQLLLNASSVHF